MTVAAVPRTPPTHLVATVVRLPADLLNEVDQIAATEMTTRAAVIRRILLGAMSPGWQDPAAL